MPSEPRELSSEFLQPPYSQTAYFLLQVRLSSGTTIQIHPKGRVCLLHPKLSLNMPWCLHLNMLADQMLSIYILVSVQ